MLSLGIDTSTPAGSVGLVDDAGLRMELNLRSGVTHSERLLTSIDSLFRITGERQEDLAVIAVASGPGSFTGLRIGMATARGLGLATGRPVVGFPTLETVALTCLQRCGVGEGSAVCVMLDAGRGEVYRGLFARSGDAVVPLSPEAAMEPARAMSGLPDGTLICGDGATRFVPALESLIPVDSILLQEAPPVGITLASRALDLVRRVAPEDLPPLEPNYLRISDAERNFKG